MNAFRQDRRGRPRGHQGPVVIQVAQPQPTVFRGDRHPERSNGGQASNDLIGYQGIALDERATHRGLTELLQPGAEFLSAARLLSRPRMRVDQIQPEVTEEYQLAEAGLMPPDLPGFLCYLACLALADMKDPFRP
jgi:hypothetical protein